ncbi:hypothetical protein [Lysobacter humi (ex Lee et al. 2017)]
MSNRRAHADRITDEIREVLASHWDPIGVMDDPEWPRDEYDSYIGEIYRYLTRGEPAEFLARHLCFIEQSRMGLGALPESTRLPVALKLKAIDVSPQAQDGPPSVTGGA